MKINKLFLLFMFSSLFFVSCNNKKCDCAKDCDNSFEPPKGTYCYENNGRPKKMLKYQEIVTMLTQYDNTRKGVLKKALGKEDTRTNFYTIKELQDYLAYIEGLCEAKQIELTGIKMISAAYPTNYSKPEYANKQTLILMPTTNINGENITFDPVQSTTKKPVTFKDLLAKYNYNWSYDSKKSTGGKNLNKAGVLSLDIMQKDLESSGLNRGTIVPPPY